MLDFIIHNKRQWITPIVIVPTPIILFVVLGGAGAAPFIHSLF